MSNPLILLVLVVLSIINIKKPVIREVSLWMCLLGAFNLIYYPPENELFFIFNLLISFLIFIQCFRLSIKSEYFLAFLPLNLVLLSGMCLNTVGLFDYLYFNSKLEMEKNLVSSGIAFISILELIGVACVSFNGLSKYTEHISLQFISGVHSFIRFVYPLEIHRSSSKND